MEIIELNTGFTVRALVVTDFSLFLSLSIFFLTKIKKKTVTAIFIQYMQTCKREPAHFYRKRYQWASLWLHSTERDTGKSGVHNFQSQ